MPLAQALQQAIKDTLAIYPGGSQIDSHIVADVVFQHRAAFNGVREPNGPKFWIHPDGSIRKVYDSARADRQQTRDYVQHLFRELYHGCRYAYQHYYTIHTEKECGAICRARRERLKASLMRRMPLCPDCFMVANLNGRCPSCDEIVPDKTRYCVTPPC